MANQTTNKNNGKDDLTGSLVYGRNGKDIIAGTDSNDELFGGNGKDIINGGAGDDVLSGGRGSDSFVYDGSSIGGNDTILDFTTGSEGDVLDLRNLLQHADFANISAYLNFEVLDGNTIITVDVDGDGSGFSDLSIELVGQEVTDVEQLLRDGNILLPTELSFWSAGDGDAEIVGTDGFDMMVIDLISPNDHVLVTPLEDGRISIVVGNETLIIDGFEEITINGTDGGNHIVVEGDFSNSDLAPNTIFFDGGSGDDTFDGSDITSGHRVVLWGNDGRDILTGSLNNDEIYGGSGNDELDGFYGNDLILGGEGDDVIIGSYDLDYQGGSTVIDFGYFGQVPVSDPSYNDILFGGDGRDTIYGGDIGGYTVNDTIFGLHYDGADWIEGGAGNDTIYGDFGNDFIMGGLDENHTGETHDLGFGSYADPLFNDLIYGGEGDDILIGSDRAGLTPELIISEGLSLLSNFSGFLTDGADKIYGGAGNDIIYGDAGNDFLYGGSGIDSISGGEGNDTINGDSGEDQIFGDAGDDIINGGDGNDIIDGGIGKNVIWGDGGNDVITGGQFEGSPELDDQQEIYGGEGNDTITGSHNHDYLSGDAGSDEISGSDGNDYILGGADNDYLSGGNDEDTLLGGQGIDTLNGGAQNDLLYGGDDEDTLRGQSGDDILYGGNAPDENGFRETDNSNDELYGGGGNDELYGDSGNDVLVGGSGDDELSGDSGNDILSGGVGHDFINGGTGIDTVIYGNYLEGEDEHVVINLLTGIAEEVTGEGEFTDTLHNIDNVIGSSGNDEITGNSRDNHLDGHYGNDIIRGGDGNDTIVGGEGFDILRVSGSYLDYEITGDHISATIVGSDGEDTLLGIEAIEFDNGPLAIFYLDGTLNGGNQPPVLTGFNINIAENTVPELLGAVSAVDPDGDAVSYGLSGVGASKFVINPVTGAISSLVSFNYEESTSYELTVTGTDLDGLSGETTVTVNIINQNEAPVSVDGIGTTTSDASVLIDVSANDSDPDSDDNESTLKYSLDIAPSKGTVINNNDGTFSFDPGTDFDSLPLGETEEIAFSYQATDSHGLTGASAKVVVTITGIDAPTGGQNAAPISVDDFDFVLSGSSVTIDVSANDSDPDSDDDESTLTYSLDIAPSKGTAINNGDGTFSFDPGSDFDDLAFNTTEVITFTYQATDSHGLTGNAAEVSVTVVGVHQADTGAAGFITVSSSGGIIGRLYDSHGNPAGEDIIIEADVEGSILQVSPTVTALHGGGFVVIWESINFGTYTKEIHLQQFSQDGSAVNGTISVSTGVGYGSHSLPDVASLSDGGFVISWTDTATSGNGVTLWAKTYDSNGISTSPFVVNAVPLNGQNSGRGTFVNPDIDQLDNGNLVFSYLDGDGGSYISGSGDNIHITLTDLAGNVLNTAVANDSLAYSYRTGTTGHNGDLWMTPTISELNDGGFVVTWASAPSAISEGQTEIYAQLFDHAGSVVGSNFVVNTTLSDAQLSPDVVVLNNGDFVITWASLINTNSADSFNILEYDVYAQVFHADGSMFGDEIKVTDTPHTGWHPAKGVTNIDALDHGGFIINWGGEAQVYNSDGTPDGNIFYAGGADIAALVSTEATEVDEIPSGLTLIGTEESDILVGSISSDTMTGNSGADTFVFVANDTGDNVITDFNAEEGDVLDFTDLFSLLSISDESGATLDDYLNFSFDGVNTNIGIDLNKDGTTDISIQLLDINLVGASNDVAIIDSLLTSSNFDVIT